ncbi:hypothetical protein HS088_TW07G00142 [Tripterygium wilfordii]|uniref:Uncharacterized protein n=1 Tax=Tripterygium wilfordii TaxID=458696 RepID=A0A7J7DE81_TRIWF|nr:hypothetical protein HS088_TW07G00142 [Tripterygium wilfordii]
MAGNSVDRRWSLQGMTALVTGGSSGIGAHSKPIHGLNCRIILLPRSGFQHTLNPNYIPTYKQSSRPRSDV